MEQAMLPQAVATPDALTFNEFLLNMKADEDEEDDSSCTLPANGGVHRVESINVQGLSSYGDARRLLLQSLHRSDHSFTWMCDCLMQMWSSGHTTPTTASDSCNQQI